MRRRWHGRVQMAAFPALIGVALVLLPPALFSSLGCAALVAPLVRAAGALLMASWLCRPSHAVTAAARTPADSVRILLAHTPDVIRDAARLGVDLMLSGHTHGGQVRFPFLGATVVPSRYGHRDSNPHDNQHSRYAERHQPAPALAGAQTGTTLGEMAGIERHPELEQT